MIEKSWISRICQVKVYNLIESIFESTSWFIILSQKNNPKLFHYFDVADYMLMIGDSNRVLIMVEDEVQKNKWRCRSLTWRRLVASRVQKATSRGFLSKVGFLGQILCHESWHFGDDSSLFATSRCSLETTYRFWWLCVLPYFHGGIFTIIWVFWSPSIF